jgi:hypothetical protein
MWRLFLFSLIVVDALQTDAAVFSIPLLRAYDLSPVHFASVLIGRLRMAAAGSGRSERAEDIIHASTERAARACETDALLFNPLDEPGE